MKYVVFLILCISNYASAQQVDILLIGASHDYSKYVTQDFSGIHSLIKEFKPTAFFGEFLSSEEERMLMDYWCKQDNLKRLNILKRNRNIPLDQIQTTVDDLTRLVNLRPFDYRLKTDLAHAHYLNQDVSNGHYMAWQVFEKLRQKPDAELQTYVDEILSPRSDTTGRSMKRLKTSEYATIAFPVMLQMRIKELHPMDSQEYDLNWSASSLAFYNKFEKMKKEYVSPELKTMLAKRDKGFEKYAETEKVSKHVTEWLNTDEAAEITASGDFYFADVYELKNFPKEEMLSQLHWWKLRNEKMCLNVVQKARTMGAKKVVVMVGANHRKFMQDIFSKMRGITVKNINQVAK